MQVETRRSGSMRTLFKDVPQAYLAPLTLSILRPSRTHLPHALVPIRTRTLRAHLLPASTNPRPLLLAPSPLTSYPRAQTLSLFPLSPSLLTSYAQSQTLALVPLSPSVLNSYPQSETLALSLPVAPHPAAPRSRAAPTLRRSTSTSPKNAAPTPRRRTSSISSPTPLRTASPTPLRPSFLSNANLADCSVSGRELAGRGGTTRARRSDLQGDVERHRRACGSERIGERAGRARRSGQPQG